MRRWAETARCTWEISKWTGQVVRLAGYTIGQILVATARGDL